MEGDERGKYGDIDQKLLDAGFFLEIERKLRVPLGASGQSIIEVAIQNAREFNLLGAKKTPPQIIDEEREAAYYEAFGADGRFLFYVVGEQQSIRRIRMGREVRYAFKLGGLLERYELPFKPNERLDSYTLRSQVPAAIVERWERPDVMIAPLAHADTTHTKVAVGPLEIKLDYFLASGGVEIRELEVELSYNKANGPNEQNLKLFDDFFNRLQARLGFPEVNDQKYTQLVKGLLERGFLPYATGLQERLSM